MMTPGPSAHIWIAAGHTDMRRGMQGLATTTVAPGSKRMRHDRDGFGRLIKAVEDPLGLNLETT